MIFKKAQKNRAIKISAIKEAFLLLSCWIAIMILPFSPLSIQDANASEADEIKSSSQDALVIVVQSNYPPFSQNHINGHPAVMFVDIWKLWSKKAGHEVTFRISDWVGTLAALKNGDADIHAGLFYSETRDQWMDYSRAFYVY
jgi:ABC-type amino acid transport substrate-binding protein